MTGVFLDRIRSASRDLARLTPAIPALVDHPDAPAVLERLGTILHETQAALAPVVAAAADDAASRQVLAEYRTRLEPFQPLLTALHAQMLDRRAALKVEESRLNAARSWANRYRDTF